MDAETTGMKGQIEPKHGRLRRLSGWALIFLTCTGFLASMPVLLRPGLPRDLALLSGAWTAGFEDELGARLVGRDAMTAIRGLLRYLVLREGEPGVEVGRGGWLFSSEEFARGADWQIGSRELLQARAALEQALPPDATLAMVLIPAKWRVSPPESRSPRIGRMVARGRESRLTELASLMGTGASSRSLVVVADSALREQDSFFLRDTHWTPQGSESVAAAVRAALQEAGAPADFGADISVGEQTGALLEGDLLAFLPFPAFHESLGLGPEAYRQREVTVSASPGIGLFDDPSVPVLLVGTSYSADPRFGFASALKQALSGDVVNFASAGAGPLEPVQALLDQDGLSEWQPDLVIWEIPERYWDPER